MKILIIGNGGREHAIAWKCAQSNKVTEVFVAPGNAGTALEPKVTNVDIDALAIEKLVAFAQKENIALTIIGPEAPLAKGIVDSFQQQHLACFGPTAKAAQLEASKAFSKAFMQRHNIPTAKYATFTDLNEAIQYIQQEPCPIVIKADGLASGKGVVIAHTKQEAIETLNEMLANKKFGEAGDRVVIEEFLQGEEASFIAVVDGEHILPLATSQDHKARNNGDTGPNTGGMGAYSPAPVVTDEIYQKIMQQILQPTVQGLAKEGCPYVGFLYAGVMITKDGQPKLLEYNCRLGDPETQPILMRLQSDLVDLCLLALDKKLNTTTIAWDKRCALGVVLCADGYPDNPKKGDIISALPEVQSDNQKIFHSGTTLISGKITTNGGRVLCVTALGDSVQEARNNAYDIVNKITWNGVYYRTDIGYRAIAREREYSV